MHFDDLDVSTITALPSSIDSKSAAIPVCPFAQEEAVKKGHDATVQLAPERMCRVRFHERSATLMPCGPGPILIYCGGFTNCYRPYAVSALKVLRNLGSQFAQCVVFKCAPDQSLRTLNFCQDPDVECVRLVLRRLVERDRESRFVLYGGCKGGSLFLKFVGDARHHAEFGSHIVSVIAESPPVSLKRALDYTPGSTITLWLLSLISRYQLNENQLIWGPNSMVPSKVKIFIGSLPGDTISQLSDVRMVMKAIGSSGNHFVSENRNLHHGRLCQDPNFVLAVRAFLADVNPI